MRGRACAVYHSAAGREVRFSDLADGEIFGDFAAIDGGPRTADVVSVTETLIASMSADLFWEVMRRHACGCAAMLRRQTLPSYGMFPPGPGRCSRREYGIDASHVDLARRAGTLRELEL